MTKPVIHLDRHIGVGGAMIGWHREVTTFADLPDATINDGKFYMVLQSSGSRLLFNYKASGLYRAEGGIWVKKNDVQLLLNDEQFTVYNAVDASKVIKFDASQINTGTIRTATWQDKNGTVAYLSDLTDSGITLSGARNKTTTNAFLETDGVFTNVVPLIIPKSATLFGISASTELVETWSAEVYKNGVLLHSLAINSLTKQQEVNLNYPLQAGDEISLYCNGTKIEKPRIIIYIKD